MPLEDFSSMHGISHPVLGCIEQKSQEFNRTLILSPTLVSMDEHENRKYFLV